MIVRETPNKGFSHQLVKPSLRETSSNNTVNTLVIELQHSGIQSATRVGIHCFHYSKPKYSVMCGNRIECLANRTARVQLNGKVHESISVPSHRRIRGHVN